MVPVLFYVLVGKVVMTLIGSPEVGWTPAGV